MNPVLESEYPWDLVETGPHLREDRLLFSFSNCPSFLAAALARATSDEVLQSDLSAHYIPKETDGTEGTVNCVLYYFHN